MEIRNKSKEPLRIPLPGGKKLHLGPGRTGKVSPKAGEFAPLKKLIEADLVELVEKESTQDSGGAGGSKGISSSQGRTSQGGVRHTGDR